MPIGAKLRFAWKYTGEGAGAIPEEIYIAEI
jgi:hypothetical protein